MKVWAEVTHDGDRMQGWLDEDEESLTDDESGAAEFDSAQEAYDAAVVLFDLDDVHELRIFEE